MRLGGPGPKALREVAGVPLFIHALRSVARSSSVDVVVIAAPADQIEQFGDLVMEEALDVDLSIVPGGDTRQESVAAALSAVPSDVAYVLVHDAARAFAPPEVFDRVVEALRDGALAVVPVRPIYDTIKQVDADGRVSGTLDRSTLRGVQTPQGFPIDILRAAHATSVVDATDDATLVEALGYEVVTVEGDPRAFKVTAPMDLLVAEALLVPDEDDAVFVEPASLSFADPSDEPIVADVDDDLIDEDLL